MHYPAVADELGDLDGGDVEGVGEGFAGGDAAHEFLAEIVGGVFLAVEFEGGGLIVDGGGGGDDGLDVIDGIVEGGGVDEGLEDGAWLAMSQGVIQLALAVVSAADDRFDFAGAGIECDQRALDLGDRLVGSLLFLLLLPLRVFFGEQGVHVLHAGLNGSSGGALQRGVQRGVDAEILAGQLVF